jgi:tRNA uridine 5-carboxymethylaminomethyl modification enzyme
MFTSRAEFRLKLRADNADQRLTPVGIGLGCISRVRSQAFAAKAAALQKGRDRLERLALTPSQAAQQLGLEINRDGRRRSAFELLAYPGVDLARVRVIWPEISALPAAIAAQLEVDARYAAYVRRQEADVAALRREESVAIPLELDFAEIAGLSTEVRQKLGRHRPVTLAQAAAIDGMTPAALFLVRAHVKKRRGAASA